MRGPNSLGLMDTERFAQYWWTRSTARITSAQEPTPYGRGKGVGGCSAVNVQVAIRGMLEDYDLWAAEGCSGWSGADVLPTFKRLEDDLDFASAPHHGRGGPLPIVRPPRSKWGAVDIALADAAIDLGYGWAEDHKRAGVYGRFPRRPQQPRWAARLYQRCLPRAGAKPRQPHHHW